VKVTLAAGETLEAERLLVAAGRKPNVDDLGLEQLGARISKRGIEVDEQLRAAENVWALGDCTGIALFTHVGKYQARVAAQNVAGREAKADYRAIPAAVFTDPQVASVGTTEGEGLVSGRWEVQSTSRASTFEKPKRPGFVKVVADPGRRVLVGAVAVGPEAGEWCQQLTLAVRAEVPVEVLLDTIQPFPTFSEAIFFALRELPL
jgi:dihydrolipoamide dehydrogenase